MNESSSSIDLPLDPHAAAAVLLGRVADAADKAAFAELYDRFSGVLFATVLTIVRDRAEAEDTLQECFCSIWDHADQYQTNRGKAVSWMMTIARNKSYDHMAKARRRGKISERMREGETGPEVLESTSRDGFDSLALNEESKAVQEAMQALPEEQRQAIQLAFMKGMSQSEVADSLKQPLGTIKARIRRGLFHLRGSLQPYLADPAS